MGNSSRLLHTCNHLIDDGDQKSKRASAKNLLLQSARSLGYLSSLAIVVGNISGAESKAKAEFKSREDNDTETEEEPTFWGQDLELSPEVWIILVLSVVVFWILLAIFLACFCGPNFIECQLCEQQVPRNQWTRLNHRENCAKDHERFLAGLKKSTFQCPRCLVRLKQWPKLGPPTFKCRAGLACPHEPAKLTVNKKRWKQKLKKVDANDKPSFDEEEATMMPGGGLVPIDVENTGENRLCCFECDFNICAKCFEFIESTNDSSNGSLVMQDKVSEKRKNVSILSNGAAWHAEGSLVRTISREVDINQATTNHRQPQRTSITQVRPQH